MPRADLIEQASADMAISRRHEGRLAVPLRTAGVLTLSLVAEVEGQLVGHVACSSIPSSESTAGWCGYGQLSVLPAQPGWGAGKALMQEGRERRRSRRAGGCVLVGGPACCCRLGSPRAVGVAHEGVPPGEPPPPRLPRLAAPGHGAVPPGAPGGAAPRRRPDWPCPLGCAIICMMTQSNKRGDAPGPCCPDLEALIDPELFKALSDPNRVALIADIGRRGRPTTVSEAAECCPVDLSVVSRHLAVLRRAGVVEAERNGRQVHYTLSTAGLASGLRSLADALEACCPPEPSTGAGPKERAHPPTEA